MKKWFCMILCVCLSCAGAAAAERAARKQSPYHFLLSMMAVAYEKPGKASAALMDAAAAAMRDETAVSVAEEWKKVWLDPDYRLYLDGKDDPAVLPVSGKHAFVVLGFELENGEMRDELKARCDAAAVAARVFPEADIEIVEIHHNRKQDVPSGTALTLAKAVQGERPGSRLVIGRHENGKREPADIDIHSLRMGNVVGVHEIHICTDTQTLTLRHEAHDRALFAEGALTAAKWITGMEPGLYDMQRVLDEILQ